VLGGRQVFLDDLIDALEVAELAGLARRTAVSVYQKRYPHMPRPVLDLGPGRPRLWLRSEVQAWLDTRES
jgi:predicted DNA-binding transcriptional regulator AlpA